MLNMFVDRQRLWVSIALLGAFASANEATAQVAAPGKCATIAAVTERRACNMNIYGDGPTPGARVVSETATAPRPGAMSVYQHMNLYWSQATGVRFVMGAIRDKYESMGGEQSLLGFPTTDELGTPDGRGRYNHFEFGSIYWTPEHGAFEAHGAIRDRWAAHGWELAGPSGDPYTPGHALGYPVTDERVAPDGRGRFNFFEHGAIYWSPDSGAHRVYGRILDQWGRDGFEAKMGYPIANPYKVRPGLGYICRDLEQAFVRPDGTGGAYCEELGWVRYRPFVPNPSGGGRAVPSSVSVSMSPPSSGPMMPAPPMTMPSSGGVWVCSTQGIPAGLVATQYNFTGCASSSGSGSLFVTKPQNDMWICAWAEGALDGFTTDRSEPGSSACNGGPRYHIVKLSN